MELFGSHRRDHKNAPADRPSPESGSGKLALTTASATRDKKLSVNAILFGILAGIIGSRPDCFSASVWAQLSQPRFMSLRLKVKPVILLPRLRYW